MYWNEFYWYVYFQIQDEDLDGKSRAIFFGSEDSLKVLDQQEDLLQEYNGDSGYEAEFQRNGDDDFDFGELLISFIFDSFKLYYDIIGVSESFKCIFILYRFIIELEEQFVQFCCVLSLVFKYFCFCLYYVFFRCFVKLDVLIVCLFNFLLYVLSICKLCRSCMIFMCLSIDIIWQRRRMLRFN